MIRWSALEDAYGPATSRENGGKTVPELLSAVVSPSKRVRAHAFEWLWARICHQGSVYPASVAAVPILIGHLERAPDRAEILDLLSGLAVGNVSDWLDGSWVAPKAPGRAGKTPESRCYAAVQSGVPTFRELLTDRKAEVRVAAAGLLAWFRDAQTTKALRQRTEKETHGLAKLAALLALGLHADPIDAARFEALVASKELALATAAAIARRYVSTKVPDAVRDALEKGSKAGELDDLRPLGAELGQHAEIVLDRLLKRRAQARAKRTRFEH